MNDTVVKYKQESKGRWAKNNEKKKKRKQAQERRKEKENRFKNKYKKRLATAIETGKGRSRATDKHLKKTEGKIYSSKTFKTYSQQVSRFNDWLEANKGNNIAFDDALGYVDAYLQSMIDQELSPWTIATAKSALAKTFGVPGTTFIRTPQRSRNKIKRSRLVTASDRHISNETEARLAVFTAATGCRRAELLKLEADALIFIQGAPHLHLTKGTKGGRERVAPIIGVSPQETQEIVEWLQARKGRGRLFPKLHTNFDNHHYRALYAKRVYLRHARNPYEIPDRREVYIMRKDRAGERLDRAAMLKASKALGHNRVDEIAKSYLYNL